MSRSFLPLLAIVLHLAASQLAHGENWPAWRGPRGDGTSLDAAPTTWDGEEGKNITWKLPLPGQGHSSPIVWQDRLLLTTCLLESNKRRLLCLDRKTGRMLWQETVITAPLESKHARNSYASGTPATDGETVFVAFLEVDGRTMVPALNVTTDRMITAGQMVVAAYDLAGNRRWLVRPGSFASVHGFCSCPVLFEDLVIINGDHDGESYLVALDKSTGKTVWKTPRRFQTRSYATPLIRTIDGEPQLILAGSRCVAGFDPRNGARLWSVEGPTEQFVASMVFDGKFFFVAAGFPTHHVMAIRPGGAGDVTDTHVAWHVSNARCYVPSPVVVNNHLLVADDRGTANCFETRTGKRLWQERLGSHFSTSLVTAEGLAYFLADDGEMQVVRPGPELEIVSENALGEYIYSSPALSEGQLFLRGEEHLFCIGKRVPPPRRAGAAMRRLE